MKFLVNLWRFLYSVCGLVPCSGRYSCRPSAAIIFCISSGSTRNVAMASVGQECVHRVVCGVHV